MSAQRILRSKKSEIAIPYKTVGEYSWKKLQEFDDNFICLINARTDEKLSIGEFKAEANAIAVALLRRGITKSDVIAFYGPNTIEHIVLRFVAYFLGITFMPLSPTFEKYEVEMECKTAHANIVFSSERDLHKFSGMIKQCNPKLILVFDGQHEKLPTYRKLVEEGRGQTLKRYPHFDVNPEKDMLFLIHTSGSTGRQKCAMIQHSSFISREYEYTEFTGCTRGGIIALIYPVGHIGGSAMIPAHVLAGATVVLIDDFTEELLMKSIEKYQVNFVPVLTNVGLRFIEGDIADKYDLSSLEVISTGGASFPGNIAKAIIDKYNVSFREAYGMTECLLLTAGPEPEDGFIAGNTGRVVPGLEVKIVDLETGESLGPNIAGEICVRGHKLFHGYLKDGGEVSFEAFDSEGWYRTGDIGRYDEEERLFITDRIKEVIRVGVGHHYVNISPVEIELFLLTNESIAEVAVVGVNNKSGTHWPRAYVILKDGKYATEEDIQKFVSDTLAYTKQLKGGVVFVDRIQRTSIGKVDRKFYRNLVKHETID